MGQVCGVPVRRNGQQHATREDTDVRRNSCDIRIVSTEITLSATTNVSTGEVLAASPRSSRSEAPSGYFSAQSESDWLDVLAGGLEPDCDVHGPAHGAPQGTYTKEWTTILDQEETFIESFRSSLADQDGLVARLKTAHEERRVLEASKLLQMLNANLGSCRDDELERWGIDVKEIRKRFNDVSTALETLHNHSSWNPVREDGLRCWYRHTHGGSGFPSTHSIKFSCEFPHSISHCVALVHEWDLIAEWNRMAKDPIVLSSESKYECVGYVAQWMPMPFSDIQVLFRANVFDLIDEDDSVLVLAENLAKHNLPAGAKHLPKQAHKRSTVLLMQPSALLLKALPPTEDGTPRTEGWMMVQVDPRMPYVPEMIIKFVTYVLAPYVYKQLKKVLLERFNEPNSLYLKRIHENPDVYKYLESRLHV